MYFLNDTKTTAHCVYQRKLLGNECLAFWLIIIVAYSLKWFWKKNYLFQVIEDDPETGCFFVGRGGFPNSKGVLECDAAVMVGDKCRFGAVAALQGWDYMYFLITI